MKTNENPTRSVTSFSGNRLFEGLLPRTPLQLPNSCSTYTTVIQEQQVREEAVTGQLRILRRELPGLLEQLGKIPDF